MTETPQNTQPEIFVARVSDDGIVTVEAGDAIPYEPLSKYVSRWQEAVHRAVEAVSVDVHRRIAAFHAIGREAHRAVHQMGWLGAFQRNRRGLRLRGLRRKRRLAFVRCDTCHPTASPKPLPRGLGTAYAARRRNR